MAELRDKVLARAEEKRHRLQLALSLAESWALELQNVHDEDAVAGHWKSALALEGWLDQALGCVPGRIHQELWRADPYAVPADADSAGR